MLNETQSNKAEKLYFSTHLLISCSMEVGRASTPTLIQNVSNNISQKTLMLDGEIIKNLLREHLLQSSKKLVQGLSKGG